MAYPKWMTVQQGRASAARYPGITVALKGLRIVPVLHSSGKAAEPDPAQASERLYPVLPSDLLAPVRWIIEMNHER